MIYLITGNNLKFKSAKTHLQKFHIALEIKKLEIIEPQHAEILYICESKATQAFNQIKKPVLVADTGIYISALNGFPGPFMHYITKWLTTEDLLNLTEKKKNKEIIFSNVITYKDDQITKSFTKDRIGKLLEKPVGEGLPLDQITTFRKNNKSIAQCQNENISRFEEDSEINLWEEFAEWYNKIH